MNEQSNYNELKNFERIAINPKRLFLIDGFGAIVSAFMLGVVLVRFENVFGIPPGILYFLALLPCIFALYDFLCYIRTNENTAFFLKGIAYLNISYCIISLGLAFYHINKVTLMGWAYLLMEIFIVLGLASLEYRTAAKISSQ